MHAVPLICPDKSPHSSCDSRGLCVFTTKYLRQYAQAPRGSSLWSGLNHRHFGGPVLRHTDFSVTDCVCLVVDKLKHVQNTPFWVYQIFSLADIFCRLVYIFCNIYEEHKNMGFFASACCYHFMKITSIIYFSCCSTIFITVANKNIIEDKMLVAIYIIDIILCMGSASKRWRYIATSSLIGWAPTQNDPCTILIIP